MGKRKGKRPLGKQKLRCEGNIKMDLKDIFGVCEHGNESLGSINKCLANWLFLRTGSAPRC
jgi:hypothetical protein